MRQVMLRKCNFSSKVTSVGRGQRRARWSQTFFWSRPKIQFARFFPVVIKPVGTTIDAGT